MCTFRLSPDHKRIEYTYRDSQLIPGSFDLSKITGVLYGAVTSTFERYKPLILNKIYMRDRSEYPFYAWLCVSFLVKERTYDFYFPNEEEIMHVFRVLLTLEPKQPNYMKKSVFFPSLKFIKL